MSLLSISINAVSNLSRLVLNPMINMHKYSLYIYLFCILFILSKADIDGNVLIDSIENIESDKNITIISPSESKELINEKEVALHESIFTTQYEYYNISKHLNSTLLESCLEGYFKSCDDDLCEYIIDKDLKGINLSEIPFRILECFLDNILLFYDSEMIQDHIHRLANIIDSGKQLLGQHDQIDRITTTKLLEFIDRTYDIASRNLTCAPQNSKLSLNLLIDCLAIVEEVIKPRIYRIELRDLKNLQPLLLSYPIDDDHDKISKQSSLLAQKYSNNTCPLLSESFVQNDHEQCSIQDIIKYHDSINVQQIYSEFLRPSRTLTEKQFRSTLYGTFIFDGIQSSNSFYEVLSWNDFLQIVAYVMFDMDIDKSGILVHNRHLESTLDDLRNHRVFIGSKSSRPFNLGYIRKVFYHAISNISESSMNYDQYLLNIPFQTLELPCPFHARLFVHMINCYFFLMESQSSIYYKDMELYGPSLLQRTFNIDSEEFFRLAPLDQATCITRGFIDASIYSLLDEEKLFRILEYIVHLDNNGFIFSKIIADLMNQHYNSNTRIFKRLSPQFIQAVQNLLLSELSPDIVSEFMSFLIPVDEELPEALDCTVNAVLANTIG